MSPGFGYVLVAVAAVVAFGRGVPAALLSSWDDDRFFAFEPIRSPSVDAFVTIWSEPQFEAYQPIHLMSYWLDVPWAVQGDGTVSGFVVHAVSLVLWALVGGIALAVFRRLGLGPAAALTAALVFTVHPIQVEAVSWATGRKDVVAALFALLATLGHLASRAPNDRYAWLARGGYLLGALAKTTVLPLPLVWILADIFLRDEGRDGSVGGLVGGSIGRAARRQVPTLALGAVLGAVVVGLWSEHELIRGTTAGELRFGAPGLLAHTLTHQLATAFVPAQLAPMYTVTTASEVGAVAWLGPLAVLGALAFAWRLRARGVLFGLGTFLVLWFPTSNLIPLYFVVHDRYLSLPLLGLAFLVGLAVDAALARAAASPRRRVVTGAVAAVVVATVVALTARTAQYAEVWSSDRRLWEHAASTSDEAFYAWLKLGEVRRDEGDYRGAVAAYDRAIALEPTLALGYAARFLATCRWDGAPEDEALALTARYGAAQSDPERLRVLTRELVEHRYERAALLALGRTLDLVPPGDDRLEEAALHWLEEEQRWLARYLVGRMTRPPADPRLREALSGDH